MKTIAPPNPQNLPQLTDALRPGLRLQAAWTICFDSWLQGVRPSEAREWLAGDKETFLRHLDSLAWSVALQVANTEQTPDDWATALREVLPMWEETADVNELDSEREDLEEAREQMDEEPLTQAEKAKLEEWAEEATGEQQNNEK